MLSTLHQLPDVVILFAVLGAMTVLAAAVPYVRLYVVRIGPNAAREEAAYDGYKAVMGMIGVVLAFSLVQANTNLQAVDTIVGKEATALAAVDRALVRSGRPDLVALRPALASFGDLIVRQEWPSLATGSRSADADAAFTKLSKGVRSFDPQDARQQTLFSELLKQVDDLSEQREQVIEASDVSLPSFFWVTALALLGLSLLLAAFTSTELKQSVGVAASAAAIGLLLAFVVIIDRPFEGETSVSSMPISKALDRNSRRSAALAVTTRQHIG